jgi:RHS repeat-associated protein
MSRYEAVIGLYDARHRHLSPSLGRWVEVDPLGFAAGDTNLYRLEGNQPTSTLDPSGLEGWKPVITAPELKSLADRAAQFVRDWKGLFEATRRGENDFEDFIGAGYLMLLRELPLTGAGFDAAEAIDGQSLAGEDLGRPLSAGERALRGAAAAVDIGTAVLPPALEGVGRVRALAKAGAKEAAALGKIGAKEAGALAKGAAREGRVAESVCETATRTCFVAGTPILVWDQEEVEPTGEAVALAGWGWGPWVGAGAAVTVGVIGWQSLGDRRRRRGRGAESQAVAGSEDADSGDSDAREPGEPGEGAMQEIPVGDTRRSHPLGLVLGSVTGQLAAGRDPAVRACASAAAASAVHTASSAPGSLRQPGRARTQVGREGRGAKCLGRCWLADWVLLAAGLAALGLWPSRPSAPAPGPHPPGRTAAQRLKPIEAIRVGERVLTDAPPGPGGSDTAVDLATWRRYALRAEARWADGTVDVIAVETLQPAGWAAAYGARVGAVVPLPLDLVEMGLPEDLWAVVLADEPCPALAPPPGRVVLTTVNHLNADVAELTLRDGQGQEDVIRPTGWHRFYREPDQSWVAACELQPGEHIRSRSGTVGVVSLCRLPGVQRVYNLTVEGEHVYYVSRLGALAHNVRCRRYNPNHPLLPSMEDAYPPPPRPAPRTGVPNPGGKLGSPSTRSQVAQIADELERRGWQITGGGGRLPEECIPGPGGGRLGSAFPDITATKNGRTLRINTIDTLADGATPTTREADNAAKIRLARPGDHLLLVPKPRR